MVIIETPIFTKQLISSLSDEEYRLFQATLLERPDAGKVIPGSGGLRKVRWGLKGERQEWRSTCNLLLVYGERDHPASVHVSEKCPGKPYPRPAQTTQENY